MSGNKRNNIASGRAGLRRVIEGIKVVGDSMASGGKKVGLLWRPIV